MEYITFIDDDKKKYFDMICEQFYEHNFGHLSKSNMELLMFHIYIEKMIDDNKKTDGTIDYNKCSDYKISKELGITQQRVRNLKVKSQLVYKIEFDWEKALASLLENARYDNVTHRITLNIPDPNLYLEIQNFIEENGSYVEKQLNSKILQMRVEYFIDLVISLEKEETSRKEIIKELRKEFKKTEKESFMFDEKNIGKSLIDGAVNITTVLSNISSILSPGNIVANSLLKLIEM